VTRTLAGGGDAADVGCAQSISITCSRASFGSRAFGGRGSVRFGGGAARRCRRSAAGDVSPARRQDLGRGADHVVIAEVEVVHVGRGLMPRSAGTAQARRVEAARAALRDLQLPSRRRQDYSFACAAART